MPGQTPQLLTVKYNFSEGIRAVDAYEGGRALLGLARSFSITTHLFVNDQVITQATALKNAQILLRPIKEGSLEFPFEFLIPGIDALRDGVYATIFWEFTKYALSRAVGAKTPTISNQTKKIISEKAGALDAVIDRLEAPLKEAHRPIGRGAENAIIIQGDNNIINLNTRSQEHLETTVRDDVPAVWSGSIASFNANSGAGGLYVEDVERVIGFHPEIDGGFDNSTKQIIVENMLSYTRRRNSKIHLRGYGERTNSGMLKRIAVTSVLKHESIS